MVGIGAFSPTAAAAAATAGGGSLSELRTVLTSRAASTQHALIMLSSPRQVKSCIRQAYESALPLPQPSRKSKVRKSLRHRDAPASHITRPSEPSRLDSGALRKAHRHVRGDSYTAGAASLATFAGDSRRLIASHPASAPFRL